jgi:hypothetical protein
LNPGLQGTQAPFTGLFSWAVEQAGFALNPFLLAAKALALGAWGSKACVARLNKPTLEMQGLARKAQSSALGPQMGKVQGSSALRLGLTILKRQAFCPAARH